MCGRFLGNLGHDDDFGADGGPAAGEEGSEGCGVSGGDFGEAPLIGWNVAQCFIDKCACISGSSVCWVNFYADFPAIGDAPA